MALPAFRSASAKAAGTGAVTPALPASMAANDIVLLVASTIAGGSISITAVGSIATWTPITGSPVDVTAGEKLYVWWGRWASGTTGPTVTPGSDHCIAGTVAYSGCITDATVINQQATGSETTSDQSFSFATGVSSTVKDCLCIGICTSGEDSNTGQVPVMANTSLAALASRLNIQTNSGGGGGFGLSEGTLAVAGSMGTWTCTIGVSSAKAYLTLALRPPNDTTSQTTTGKARVQITSKGRPTWAAKTAAEANSWKSVCWSPELRLFVAVAITGTHRVMTSTDGTNWSAVTAAEANTWNSVCWSPALGIFVAVSSDGTHRVMTSSDGSSWNFQTEAEANPWKSVCWSPSLGLFVAVASSGTNRVMTSANGSSWSPQSDSAGHGAWASVCWSPDLSLFVAVSASGTDLIMTSANGTAWTARTSPVSISWVSVCWSPELGLFCAIASGTDLMTSANGTAWTARTGPSGTYNGIAWSPEMGLFVGVSQSASGIITYSDNGTKWLSQTAPEANAFNSVCWSPDLRIFVAVASSGTSRVMINPELLIGRARIQVTTTKTTTGKANIAAGNTTTTRTQPGKARIQVSTTRTQTGKAAVQSTTTRTQPGKSRVQIRSSATETGRARVQVTTTKTTIGKATVQATTSRTQTGKARIRVTASQTTTGRARVQVTTTRTQPGKAQVRVTTTRTIQGRARIGLVTSQTTTGKAFVESPTHDQTIQGRARVQKSVTKNQTGTARISSAGGETAGRPPFWTPLIPHGWPWRKGEQKPEVQPRHDNAVVGTLSATAELGTVTVSGEATVTTGPALAANVVPVLVRARGDCNAVLHPVALAASIGSGVEVRAVRNPTDEQLAMILLNL